MFLSNDFFYRNGLPYPSDFAVFCVFFVLISFVLYLPLTYFLKLKWISLITAALSFLFTWGFIILQSFGSAMANSTTASTMSLQEKLSVFFLCAAALFIIYIGALQLTTLLKEHIFRWFIFVPWFFITAGFPLALYFNQVLTYRAQINNNINMNIEIVTNTFYPVIIEELKFVNTANKREQLIRFRNNAPDITPDSQPAPGELLQMQSDHNTTIPKSADKLYIKYYSPVENRFYNDFGEFAFNKIEIEERHGRQLHADNLQLFIKPNGRIDFFQPANNKNLFYFFNIEFETISDEKIEDMLNTSFSKDELVKLKKIIDNNKIRVANYKAPAPFPIKYQADLKEYWLTVDDLFGFTTKRSNEIYETGYDLFLPRKIIIQDKDSSKKHVIYIDEFEIEGIADKLMKNSNSEEFLVIMVDTDKRRVSLKRGAAVKILTNFTFEPAK